MEKALHKLQKGRLHAVNRKNYYADIEKWRSACRRQRKRYYGKTQGYERREWTQKEIEMVLARDMTDMELSALIHRSVQSIQIKRTRLLKSMNG